MFDHPFTVVIVSVVAGLLAITPVVFRLVPATPELRRELYARYWSWLVIAPVIVVPILLGPLWAVGGFGLLSLFCYREFARATGLFRNSKLSAVVVAGIGIVTYAAATGWYGLFAAAPPLVILLIAVVALMPDTPAGYIQRVALAAFAFLLLGYGIGHLGFWANDPGYRPILLATIVCVELNDVFAFTIGKTMGRRKIAPGTSPNKTLAGCVGAALVTTLLFATCARFVFDGELAKPAHGLLMGFILASGALFGDLVLSSIKRDLGVKDMAATIPGHGGLLDRFDSMLLVAPALFHYVRYFA